MKVQVQITPSRSKEYPYKVRVFVGGVYQPGATMECKTSESAQQEADQLRRAFNGRP